jgi:uncharacterized glyoxalase superfamily protein PhnB
VSESSASAAVEVSLDPLGAFTVFTAEIDSWWVRGPINFFDASNAVEMRFEPGVGGRILEIYDEASGAALELGRVTVWEPGARLAYRSSVDDTEVDVRFEGVEGGTRVRVTQSLVPGGERALLFWPRVLRWLVPWCRERDGAGGGTRELARLSVAIYYEDPAAAARWLARVFQLGSWAGIPAEGEEPLWIELHVGSVAVFLFRREGESTETSPTHALWVYVDDLDSHFAHARANGARIVSGIETHGYRGYVAEDVEGRRWTFAQARPTMA